MNIYPNLRVDALQYVINKYKNIKMTYVPVSAVSLGVVCAREILNICLLCKKQVKIDNFLTNQNLTWKAKCILL